MFHGKALRTCVSFALLALVASCAHRTHRGRFEHHVTHPTPWTHERFDDAANKFTFAIVTDLTGGERPRVFEVAVAQLALLRPELILSVGDLIEGGTEDRAQLDKEWNHFDARAAKARAPIFRVGGNHDLTNTVMRDVWAERHGPRYYHFVYKNVLFLVLDTEDNPVERMQAIYRARAAAIEVLASDQPERATDMEYFRMPERVTGAIGKPQSDYFQQVIADHPNVRWTMLFMHKPIWQRDRESEFTAIVGALGDRPYTVFNGHLHSFAHATKNGRDHTTLGTSGGAQPVADPMSFDHVTLVTMDDDGPTVAHIRLDGILDRTGHIPRGADDLCFQASRCAELDPNDD